MRSKVMAHETLNHTISTIHVESLVIQSCHPIYYTTQHDLYPSSNKYRNILMIIYCRRNDKKLFIRKFFKELIQTKYYIA